MNIKQYNQKQSDLLQNKVDLKIQNQLKITKIKEKQMIWSLQQSQNGRLIISIFNESLNIRSSGNLKLLMKRYYKQGGLHSCFNDNFKLFAIASHDGNLYIYQNFFTLIYHKKFDIQQHVKFITNDYALIWNTQYLMKLNVINQQMDFKMTLNKKFPINDLDYSIEKQLIFIGSNNIKIRSINNGKILLESLTLKNDKVQYIKYQQNNNITTSHILNQIIIWKLNLEQDKIEQVHIINPIDNLDIIYTSIIKTDYIFSIQRVRNHLTPGLWAIIYNKSGNIINVKQLEKKSSGILMSGLMGQFVNQQRNNCKYLFIQTYDICYKILLNI